MGKQICLLISVFLLLNEQNFHPSPYEAHKNAPPCFLALTTTALSVRCWSHISVYLLSYKILNSAIVCACASHSINSNRDPDGMQVVLPVKLRERCLFFFSAWKRSMSAQCIPMIYSPIVVCCFTTLPFIR